MEVKQAIISALKILNRGDLAESLRSNTPLDGEGKETVNVLIYCFNAVEDELARKYFPLTAKEQLSSKDGKFYYTAFAHPPVKIKSIKAGDSEVKYQLEPLYAAVNEKIITVEYEYAPSKKDIGDESELGERVSENLVACGIAAEYSLINGEIEQAELWEKKYRKLIDGAQSALPKGGAIPPRRWV